jgi:hypothetical protein
VAVAYGDDPAQPLREKVAAALVIKGASLANLERLHDGLAVYEQVIAKYRDDPAPVLCLQVAMALGNKAFTLRELGRSDQALAVYKDVIATYAGDPVLAHNEVVARAARAIDEVTHDSA